MGPPAGLCGAAPQAAVLAAGLWAANRTQGTTPEATLIREWTFPSNTAVGGAF